jgi:hypothetical protein
MKMISLRELGRLTERVGVTLMVMQTEDGILQECFRVHIKRATANYLLDTPVQGNA